MLTEPPMIFCDVCAEFGMSASAEFGPAMIWDIGQELFAHELAATLISEAAMGSAEAVAVDRLVAKSVGSFVIGSVVWPYRIYRLYRLIKWIDEVAAKPGIRRLLEDAIRRACARRAEEPGEPEAVTGEKRLT